MRVSYAVRNGLAMALAWKTIMRLLDYIFRKLPRAAICDLPCKRNRVGVVVAYMEADSAYMEANSAQPCHSWLMHVVPRNCGHLASQVLSDTYLCYLKPLLY